MKQFLKKKKKMFLFVSTENAQLPTERLESPPSVIFQVYNLNAKKSTKEWIVIQDYKTTEKETCVEWVHKLLSSKY